MCSICTPHVVNLCNMSENMSHLPFSRKPYLSYISVNMSVTIWPCILNIPATYQPHINENPNMHHTSLYQPYIRKLDWEFLCTVLWSEKDVQGSWHCLKTSTYVHGQMSDRGCIYADTWSKDHQWSERKFYPWSTS